MSTYYGRRCCTWWRHCKVSCLRASVLASKHSCCWLKLGYVLPLNCMLNIFQSEGFSGGTVMWKGGDSLIPACEKTGLFLPTFWSEYYDFCHPEETNVNTLMKRSMNKILCNMTTMLSAHLNKYSITWWCQVYLVDECRGHAMVQLLFVATEWTALAVMPAWVCSVYEAVYQSPAQRWSSIAFIASS